MSTKHRADSFLKNASVGPDNIFLGVNNLPKVPASLQDERYSIGHAFEERPDLLAHKLYGNSRLWWVFALRNPDELKDPIRDFKSGLSIFVPSKESVTNYIAPRS